MSCIESDANPVAENIEEEETKQIANVPDMSESIGTEHTSDAGQNESTCSKCDALASRVIKLQKKISWLKNPNRS